MALTAPQLASLKAAILADGTLSPLANNSDGNQVIANAFNLTASPTFVIWKKLVTVSSVGDNLNGTELAGLTSLNHTRLQTVVILSENGINPSLADRRQFFDDIFSGAGGTTTRANLLALWKKNATRAEKLFSTGTGTDGSPATTDSNIGQTFILTASDVEAARNS
jgi:hypothetical protein